MMNREIGYVRRALTVIEEAGIPFDHIPTGIDSLSMVIETSALEDKLDDVLDELKLRLKPDEISVEDNIALIAVVGRKMNRTTGVAAKICSALAQNGINIRMLNQGTSEINIIVGVEAGDFEKAVNIIYTEFMG
jgi:aspartate kinase